MDLDQHDDDTSADEWTGQWWASIRLATVFSILAGVGALLLAGRVPETTIVLSVIVLGTMVSWFHLDGAPRAATVRHPRRHRR